ncbi:MAG: UDP-N-acetylmuramate--L-alanine ligase [Planctomycetes bacterium]|nr:UDP-N-acetylmuramate--L-alanine ligase [Planctomycetota bacterium]
MTAPSSGSAPFGGGPVHCIGIGGIGLSGLAKCLLADGLAVSGSDEHPSPLLATLEALGAAVQIGHAAARLPEGTACVVRSAAVSDANPEVVEARRRGRPVLFYAEALAAFVNSRQGIAVSGCHGKTTTSALIAHTLRRAGFDPGFVVGGILREFATNAGAGRGRHFVAEACEYNRSFLALRPRCAIVTNIEADHLDTYGTLDAVVEAFGEFLFNVPPEGLAIVNGDDSRARSAAARARARVETVSVEGRGDWMARRIESRAGHYRFEVVHRDSIVAWLSLATPGRHQIPNALAAFAACRWAGLAPVAIAEAFTDFHGVARRFEAKGERDGVTVIDDYGHHPTEIRAVGATAREIFPGRRLWAVFQPHQHSRTRLLFGDFARSFDSFDRVVISDIYRARDTEEDVRSVGAGDLAEAVSARGVSAVAGGSIEETVQRLCAEARDGDVILTLGAGDVHRVGADFLHGAVCPRQAEVPVGSGA